MGSSATALQAPLREETLLLVRYYLCGLFAWGVLTEEAVQEASEELRRQGVRGVVDPFAGTGSGP